MLEEDTDVISEVVKVLECVNDSIESLIEAMRLTQSSCDLLERRIMNLEQQRFNFNP